MSQPHNGSYLPGPVREMTTTLPQLRPSAVVRTSNSLLALHPSESTTVARHPSTNNIWVRHEFPNLNPQTHPHFNPSAPQPGFLELRHSTFSSLTPQGTMGPTTGKLISKKRQFISGEEKKPKARKAKAKTGKKESVRSSRSLFVTLLTLIKVFDDSIYMRILEFTPPAFLSKARLISRSFKDYVDKFTSIYVNLRKENFGFDMPPPPKHLTDQQYNELLGGKKGCLAEGCDDKRAIRTHWSWYKRWCWECWKERIEREDRVLKSRGILYGRAILLKMLECIPVGMHDSFMKPHDYIDNIETRSRGAPRLYKYYLNEDINRIIKEFESLTPAPYVENPNHTAAERATALTAHQELMDGLEDKRTAFFAERKAQNDEHMDQVQKIEAGIRMRRVRNRDPYDGNRNARKELFSKRASEDIPHIDLAFVRRTAAYKAATRIFRDAGTERGWLTLKPKIIAEWEVARAKREEESGGHMDSLDASDARGGAGDGTGMGGPNEDRRDSADSYHRLQDYQTQLQRLEESKQSRRAFAPHGLLGNQQVDYSHCPAQLPGFILVQWEQR